MNDLNVASHGSRKARSTRALAFGAAAITLTSGGLCAAPAFANDVDSSQYTAAAHAHLISLEGLGIDVAGLIEANANDDARGPVTDQLNVALLDEAINLDLGDGLELPLIGDGTNNGLLEFGADAGVGVLSSYAAAPSDTSATASSGTVAEDGTIALDDSNAGSSDAAKLNLTPLLATVLGETVVDSLLDTAAIEIGALASTASKTDGAVTSAYTLADLGLDVHSEAVATLTNTVDGAVDTLLSTVTPLVGEGGAVETLVSTLVDSLNAVPLVEASLSGLALTGVDELKETVRTELLKAPLENSDGSISIDLNTGSVHVDLAGILLESTGASSLNELPANTEVLTADTISAIIDGLTDALTGTGENSLTSKVTALLTTGVYELGLNLDVSVAVGTGDVPLVGDLLPNVVEAPVTVSGTIGGFLGQEGYNEPTVDTSQISVAGVDLGTVVQPIVELLTGLVSDIGSEALQPVVTTLLDDLKPTVDGVLNPVLDTLIGDTGALRTLLDSLATITINEQPTVGDLGEGSFTVRALNVTLLPALEDRAVSLELASSTVKAADEAIVPTPTETEEPTPTPTETEEPTPTPTESEQPTPTPTETEEPTPTPTESEQPIPASSTPAATQTADTDEKPGLATTGATLAPMALLALVLVALGSGLFLAKRRNSQLGSRSLPLHVGVLSRLTGRGPPLSFSRVPKIMTAIDQK